MSVLSYLEVLFRLPHGSSIIHDLGAGSSRGRTLPLELKQDGEPTFPFGIVAAKKKQIASHRFRPFIMFPPSPGCSLRSSPPS